MTCLNGYFHDAALDSLSESLMKAQRGGAVAVWASSGTTTPEGQVLLNDELFTQLFNVNRTMDRPATVGEATQRAKQAVGDADIRRTWILLGIHNEAQVVRRFFTVF